MQARTIFLTKGTGPGRKVIPIKKSVGSKVSKAAVGMTMIDLAHLLIDVMDPSGMEEYIHDRISNQLSANKAYLDKMSSKYSESDKDELAYIIVDDMEDKEVLDLAFRFKLQELQADLSYYRSALDMFNRRKMKR